MMMYTSFDVCTTLKCSPLKIQNLEFSAAAFGKMEFSGTCTYLKGT